MTALAFKKYLHVQFFPCFMHVPMYVVRGMLFGHLWEADVGDADLTHHTVCPPWEPTAQVFVGLGTREKLNF